jgi:predicted phage tail protein
MFTVQKGKEFLDYDNLQMNLGENDLIITPVPAGSANKLLKVIVGFVLMVVGAAFMMGMLGLSGWAAVAAGVAAGMAGSMLLNSGMAEYMAPKKPGEQNDAFLFDGPVNTVKEGLPVPLAYGQVLVGGATISFGFTDREVSSASGFTFSSSTGGTSINYGDSPPNSGEPEGSDVSGPPNTDVQKNVSIDWNLGKGGQ